MNSRKFQLILIKPSHYDDDGYVVQWMRSFIPANTLAVMYSLARDASTRNVLGADAAIDLTAIDETNTRVNIDQLVATFRRNAGFGLVGLVGVQSNQFPRAMDLARQFRAAGMPVVIGGFHVSGCLAMLPEMPADLREALDLGISLFAGEAEDCWDDLLQDAAAGSLKPIYNRLKDLPALQSKAPPFLPRSYVSRTAGRITSFDAGRGCPYQCSFCTIINVQGRKSRGRSADDIEALIRENVAQGITRFFVTDDNLARNKDWEAIFDRLIQLREQDGFRLSLTIQVDTLCHKIPRFIEKAGRAGVRRVFIGLENINPDNLLGAKKNQNKITEYRSLLLAWKAVGVITYAGYILGFPNDTPESIRRDIEIIKKELPLDILEFFCLTPLPGSEDHKALWTKGVEMDADMNRYDGEHVVTAHPKMTRAEWEEAYRAAWETFYTPEHMETILRRAAATNIGTSRAADMLFVFSSAVPVEKVHPLQIGLFRRKFRKDRRSGMPVEPVWAFYPRYWFETASKASQLLRRFWAIDRMARRIKKDPAKMRYMDQALTPVSDEEDERLELFTQTQAARSATAHARKIASITASSRAAAHAHQA